MPALSDQVVDQDVSVKKKSRFGSPDKERPTLKWPHLYDKLRDKGMGKEKSARISNSMRRKRKKGRLTTKQGREAARRRRELKKELPMDTTLIDKYDTDPAITILEYEVRDSIAKAAKIEKTQTGVSRSIRADVIRYGDDKGKVQLYVNESEEHTFDTIDEVNKFLGLSIKKNDDVPAGMSGMPKKMQQMAAKKRARARRKKQGDSSNKDY